MEKTESEWKFPSGEVCFLVYFVLSVTSTLGSYVPPAANYAIFRARLKLPRSLLIFSCSCRME